MPWLRHVQGTDAWYIVATQLLPHACELAKEEYHEWADGLFPSLSCVHEGGILQTHTLDLCNTQTVHSLPYSSQIQTTH